MHDVGRLGTQLTRAGLAWFWQFLLGAQKSGTSSLVKDLERSMAGLRGPKIPPRFRRDPGYMKKEVHFFDSEERYAKGPKLYASCTLNRTPRMPRALMAMFGRAVSLCGQLSQGSRRGDNSSVILHDTTVTGKLLPPARPMLVAQLTVGVLPRPLLSAPVLHLHQDFPKCNNNLSLAGQHRSYARRADGSPGRAARPFACFDATPNYFTQRFAHGQGNNPWDRCAEYMGTRLQSGGADALVFLIILRNPIDRFFSAINHLEPDTNKTMLERAQQAVDTCKHPPGHLPKRAVRLQAIDTDPETRVAQNAPSQLKVESQQAIVGDCWVEDDVLRTGIYAPPLMGWTKRFPSSTFLITTMSGYQTDPNPLLAEVARSVGLEHRPINRLAKVNSGANKADTIAEYAGAASLRDADARAVLGEFYSSRSAMFWEELRKLQAQEATPRVEFFGEHGIF